MLAEIMFFSCVTVCTIVVVAALVYEGFPLKQIVAVLFSVSLIGFIVGCNTAYKPNINVEHADIQHQSGNSAQIKGEYNAK